MKWLKQLLSRSSRYDELSASIREHLDEKIADLIDRGMTREQAEQTARREFGNVTRIEERSREVWQRAKLESICADLGYALRQLTRSPGFSSVVILSLALGIGATTSMFSLIYAVLLHPMPYADWQRLAYPICYNDDQPTSPEWWFSLNWAQYQQLRQARSIADVSGLDTENSETTGNELPEDVFVNYVNENLGNFTGVPPLFGRSLQLSDARDTTQAPIVLSYEFWMRHYDGDRNVVGKILELDHKPYTIVGVAAKDFGWGFPGIYAPISLLPTRERNIIPVMKLRPGVSLAAANSEIDSLVHQFAKETPEHFPKRFRMHLEGVRDRVIEYGGRALALLFVAVVILLIIGCANCSILLLARSMAREGEFAVRAALGAGRPRIVRQLLIEALVLAIAGSMLGIGLAWWMAKLIFGLFPDVFMHESVIRINLPILAFSVALALLSGLLFGLLPSLRMSRPNVSQMVQGGGRKIAGRVGHARSLNTLIAAQIALTMVMMGGAGAAINGFVRMTHRSFGYDPVHVMSVPVPLHPHSYLTREERAAYFETLRQKIATVPGVTQVSISTGATPPDSGDNLIFDVLGSPFAQRQFLRANFISQEYFATLHIPLLDGRLWDRSESNRGVAVAVVNQTLARRYFPNDNAIGQQIRLSTLTIRPDSDGQVVGVPDTDGWLQVIGVPNPAILAGQTDVPERPRPRLAPLARQRRATAISSRAVLRKARSCAARPVFCPEC
jgi:predicted permease